MMAFHWTGKRERAALLAAEDEQSDSKIAASIGLTEITITRWKRDPEFQARVAENVERIRAAVLAEGIANKQNRVDALNDRWRRMQKVIAERADDSAMADVSGGSTGLLTHIIKMIGQGERAQRIDEYAVDTGLLKEMREHEKQAAIELSQWSERQEITGADGGPVQVEDARARLSSKLDILAARRRARPADSEPERE
jgi:hypothetical protein